MSKNRLDYLIIGPAYPFRGGIADTQHELAKHLQEIGKEVQLLTFSKLYPKFLFPGKNQKTETPIPNTVDSHTSNTRIQSFEVEEDRSIYPTTKPTICHFSLLHSIFSTTIRLACKKYRF